MLMNSATVAVRSDMLNLASTVGEILRALYFYGADYIILTKGRKDRLLHKEQLVALLEQGRDEATLEDLMTMNLNEPLAAKMQIEDIPQDTGLLVFVQPGKGGAGGLSRMNFGEYREQKIKESMIVMPDWWGIPLPLFHTDDDRVFLNETAQGLVMGGASALLGQLDRIVRDRIATVKAEGVERTYSFAPLSENTYFIEDISGDFEMAEDLVWWAAVGKAFIQRMESNGLQVKRLSPYEEPPKNAAEVIDCSWEGELVGRLVFNLPVRKKPDTPAPQQAEAPRPTAPQATSKPAAAQPAAAKPISPAPVPLAQPKPSVPPQSAKPAQTPPVAAQTRLEKTGKTEKTEKTEKPEQPKQIEKLEKIEPAEKTKKLESVAKPKTVEPVEKLDRAAEKPKKIEKIPPAPMIEVAKFAPPEPERTEAMPEAKEKNALLPEMPQAEPSDTLPEEPKATPIKKTPKVPQKRKILKKSPAKATKASVAEVTPDEASETDAPRSALDTPEKPDQAEALRARAKADKAERAQAEKTKRAEGPAQMTEAEDAPPIPEHADDGDERIPEIVPELTRSAAKNAYAMRGLNPKLKTKK